IFFLFQAEDGIRALTVTGVQTCALPILLGAEYAARFVCLSGPSFAQEVAARQPTAVVAACADQSLGETVQAVLSFENLRIYTNTDVAGTELGGAVKNVIAVAAGMCSGVGLGAKRMAAR